MKRFMLGLILAFINTNLIFSKEFDADLLHSFSLEVLENEDYRRQLQVEMSSDCLDKLCYMLQSFTTCEVFPIQWEKDCSRYFVGYLVECPAYPPKSAITDAPSVCMQDLMSLGGGMPNMSDIMMGGNRSQDCQLHCYQTYLERTLDLFDSCESELKVSRFQKVAQISTFQVYRGQVCAMNANSKNCVDLLPDPTEPSPQPSPLFDYSCSLPDQAYANMCVQFSVLECCFANQLTVLEQTLNQMYAPCVMNRLSQCPIPVFTDTFCSEGTLRDLSTVSCTIEINLLPSQGLPIMSNINSTLQFRAIVSAPLGLSPLQVVVMSYEYFNETSSVGENAIAATFGRFSVMIVDASSSNSTWQQDIDIVSSPQYIGGIAMGYNTSAANIGVTLDSKKYYTADPIETSAAFSVLKASGGVSLLFFALTLLLSLISEC